MSKTTGETTQSKRSGKVSRARTWVAPRNGGYAPENAREPRSVPTSPAAVTSSKQGQGHG